MRRLILLVCALCGITSSGYGYGILWYAESGFLHYADGSTKLNGDTSSSFGCFVQLLWVGANGTIDAAYNSDSGAGIGSSDDVVVDKLWVGAGFANGADGWFSGGNVPEGGNMVSGRTYFARAWSAPALDYNNGFVPTSLTNKYGDSSTFTWRRILDGGDSFDVANPSFSTTQTPLAIPEPAVLALALTGILCLRLFKRNKA
jgi:hypothetical protein